MRSANAHLRDKLPFDASTFAVALGSSERVFVRPRDADTVLAAITDEQFRHDEQLPYWAEHWPSADVLVRYVYRNRPAHGSRACELGCGLGVVSSILAAEGVRVVATDISQTACRYTRANCSGAAAAAQVICADWRYPPMHQAFDLVVGADVLYEARWVDPVLTCIHDLLLPGGTALIADPRRGHWQAFQDLAVRTGFAAEIVHTETLNHGRTSVDILRLHKPHGSPDS